jgi:hypothetical protein
VAVAVVVVVVVASAAAVVLVAVAVAAAQDNCIHLFIQPWTFHCTMVFLQSELSFTTCPSL